MMSTFNGPNPSEPVPLRGSRPETPFGVEGPPAKGRDERLASCNENIVRQAARGARERHKQDYPANPVKKISVLVVDDEPDIVRIVGRALQGAGYKVLEAYDATSAWKLLRRNPVDIIVCDIMMPEVSGLDLCRSVKRDARLQECHFILLTAKSGVDERVAGLDAGADDYIPKPFDIQELLARVNAGRRIVSSRRQLHEDSVTDPLTGLYTRRVLWAFLDKELARARRYDYDLSMLVIDIDHFKRLNDTYGHLAGDEVLRQIGRLIRQRLRKSDVAVRFGGEEFVLLLPQTDSSGAEVLGRRLCEAVCNKQFQYQDKPLPAAVSIGAASLADYPDATPQTLFEQADAAMYQAKQAGGNRVLTAGNTRPERIDASTKTVADNAKGKN